MTHPKLKIVYEDDDLIVVNKQPGLLTVASTPGSSETTAYSILRAYVKKQNARAGIYVVHRLDRETSGLLVFARSEELQHYMREYWRELVQERTYIALAEGTLNPREGKITTWLTEEWWATANTATAMRAVRSTGSVCTPKCWRLSILQRRRPCASRVLFRKNLTE